MHRREFLSKTEQWGRGLLCAATFDRLGLSSSVATAQSDTPVMRRLSLDQQTLGARAVVVGQVPLLHTPQVHAWDDAGRVLAQGSVADRVGKAWDRLEQALMAGGSSPEQLVRLHVVARSVEAVSAIKRHVEAKLPVDKRPAITFVVGALSEAESVVAFDAVAVCREAPALVTALPKVHASAANSAVLPRGGRMDIAGQAEKGATPREAARATMESLKRTLAERELELSQVVQIKSFLTPITAQVEVDEELAAFFPKGKGPPRVYVEWKSNLPIEIELVAAVPVEKLGFANLKGTVEFTTPKGMTTSPIFSRVAVAHGNTTIYTGGLTSAGETGEAQVRGIFEQLKAIASETGSDLKHLVKATYYVATDDTSAKLNAVRPEFYDPKRPPSASKAMVQGTGFSDRGLTIDMIAVEQGRNP